MTYLTILEKLKILLDILLDYKIILIFTILLIILTLLYLVKILNKKKYILSMILSFIVVFSISIISNYKILSTTFDNFTTIFFRGIYFPSIYLYITTLILLLVVFIMSILSIKLPKTYKVINTTAFIINNIFLAIILNIIAKNKIDIFSVNSLYTNTNLVVILELNMSIIIIWLLSLIVVYLTNIICDRITLKKKTKVPTTNEIVIDNIPLEESSNNKVVEEPVLVKDKIIVTSSANTKEKENNVIKESKVTFNDILNGTVKAIYYDNNSNKNIEYNITNPQEEYEKKYKDKKSENISFQDVIDENRVLPTIKPNKVIIEEPKVTVEEITKREKAKNIKERLSNNTISLDSLVEPSELVEEPISIVDTEKEDNTLIEEKHTSKSTYTLEDYKKMITMLKELKQFTNSSNISVDDAINISLISNYSIDDCLKFKEMLEGNLN